MKNYLLIMLFISVVSNTFSQVPSSVKEKSLIGVYASKTFEKDSIINEMVQVVQTLVLNKDSSFTFTRQINSGHCDNNRGGFWTTNNRNLILEFVGEDPLFLDINEGSNYLSLLNKSKKLTLVKQLRSSNPADPVQYKNYRPRHNSKDPKCPTF